MNKNNFLLLSIVATGIIIRLLLISQDQFLYSWDERFHALVAKNLIDNPLMPVLRLDPIIGYDYKQWCCNHVWLHKPPLFLWQMAVSIWIFGANEFAVRIPSLLMSAGFIFLVYKIGKLLHDKSTGLFASFAACVSIYQIERTTGYTSTDHNDVAFVFYMTLALYFLLKSVEQRSTKILYYFGISVGLAALVKGPQALIIILLLPLLSFKYFTSSSPFKFRAMVKCVFLFIAIYLPWNLYTTLRFPVESSHERSYSLSHILEPVEGHSGSIWWYFQQLEHQYGWLNILLFCLGFCVLIFMRKKNERLRLPLIYLLLIYFFYSLIVQTKMPGYVFIASPIIFFFVGYGLNEIFRSIQKVNSLKSPILPNIGLGILMIVFTWYSLRPVELYKYHFLDERTEYFWWPGRKEKEGNAIVYKKLNNVLPEDCLIFNMPPFEDVEVMFYTGRNAYQYLGQQLYFDLKKEGKCIAYFKNVKNQPVLPWVKEDDEIIWIEEALDFN